MEDPENQTTSQFQNGFPGQIQEKTLCFLHRTGIPNDLLQIRAISEIQPQVKNSENGKCQRQVSGNKESWKREAFDGYASKSPENQKVIRRKSVFEQQNQNN